MPHGGEPRAGEDLLPSDEIKVFKEEGDEDEHQSSENLTEVKTSLVTEGEEEKSSDVPGPNEYGSPPKNSSDVCRPDSASHTGRASKLRPILQESRKAFDHIPPHSGPIPYLVSSYHPHNGSLGPMPMAGKVPMVPPHSGSPLPFMVNIHGEPFPPQPPPAHMGIPPVTIDPKTGIPSRAMYIGPPAQYPPVFTPDFTHQLQWHPPSLYPTTSAGFRSAYSSALPVTSANLPRFSPPTILTHYPGISHPALISTGPKQELSLHHTNHRYPLSLPEYSEQKYSPKSLVPTSTHNNNNNDITNNNGERKTHIKKPLNAFMLYMKEMRAKVVAECTLKESAAINQILGRKWHGLSRDEQAKYYEMARKERQLHMQKYPGWSARDNYALQVKKKKRKRDRTQDGDGNNLKKCRARFGLDQQNSWCKPCRRKKKCIRYLDGADNSIESEDNLGSAGSVEAPTPDSNKTEDTDSQDLDNIQNNNSPLSPCTDEMDTKPRLDSNGMLRPQSPPRNLHQHLYHHPYSVRQLIQPHHYDSHHHHHRASPMKSSLITRTDPMSRFQNPSEVSTASQQPPPPPMLTVT